MIRENYLRSDEPTGESKGRRKKEKPNPKNSLKFIIWWELRTAIEKSSKCYAKKCIQQELMVDGWLP